MKYLKLFENFKIENPINSGYYIVKAFGNFDIYYYDINRGWLYAKKNTTLIVDVEAPDSWQNIPTAFRDTTVELPKENCTVVGYIFRNVYKTFEFVDGVFYDGKIVSENPKGWQYIKNI